MIATAAMDAIYSGLQGLFAPLDIFAIIFPLLLLGVALLLLVNKPWAVWVTLLWVILDLAGGALFFWPTQASPETILQWVVLVLSIGFKISAISYLVNNVRGLTPRTAS